MTPQLPARIRTRFWSAIPAVPLLAASLLVAGAGAPAVGEASGLPYVSAGVEFTCAINADSIVYCWGRNDVGQLGDNATSPFNNPVPVLVEGPPATALSTGQYHACEIDTFGNAWCWGDNADGQLGDGTTTNRSIPVMVHGGIKFTHIAAGGFFTCGISTAGAVYCWGDNSDGELGVGTVSSKVPVLVSSLRVSAVQIAAGIDKHVCALLTNGSVECWGANSHGQVGDGTTTNRHTPVAVKGLTSGVTAITAGGGHTCAIVGGGLLCWGDNAYGEVGDGTTTDRIVPTPVGGLSSGVEQVSANAYHTCALVSAGPTLIDCWGDGRYGELGDGVATGHPNRLVPTMVFGLEGSAAGGPGGPVQVSAGGEHTCAVIGTGQVECWGNNSFGGEIGDGTLMNRFIPTYVIGLTIGVQGITEGAWVGCAVTETLTVACWGTEDGNDFNQHPAAVVVAGLPSDVAQLGAGYGASCALATAGSLRCWGANPNGEVGDGNTSQQPTPQVVTSWPGGTPSIGAVSAGTDATCAVSATNIAYCWGDGDFGELGNGHEFVRDVPVKVINIGSVAQISAAGETTACAIALSASAYCWGANEYGEIGSGTTIDTDAPVKVKGLPDAPVQIATGGGPSETNAYGDFSCAVLANGDVYCWGYDGSGQLGNGAAPDESPHVTPVAVLLPSPAREVVTGEYTACALLDVGSVWCWGDNVYGELGTGGSPTTSPTPVEVSGLTSGVLAISADDSDSTCALLASPSEVECWGDNSQDELGDGVTGGMATTPQVVQGL